MSSCKKIFVKRLKTLNRVKKRSEKTKKGQVARLVKKVTKQFCKFQVSNFNLFLIHRNYFIMPLMHKNEKREFKNIVLFNIFDLPNLLPFLTKVPHNFGKKLDDPHVICNIRYISICVAPWRKIQHAKNFTWAFAR